MTSGSPLKKVIIFSIPLIIGNLFQLLYNMVDTLIVGRTMGLEALAGIGAAGSVSFLILGFSQGFTAGLAIPIAQAYGARDYRKLQRSVLLNWILALSVSAILIAISLFSLRAILTFMKTPDNIVEYTYSYLSIIFGFMFVTVLYNMLNNLMRSLGDSRTPLYFLIVAALTNIVLDYAFIIYFGLGVAGTAIATILSQGLAVTLCLIAIHKQWPILKVRLDVGIKKEELMYHLRIALPMAFQSSIIAIGTIAVTMALNALGAVAVASYSAAQKVDQVVILILMSFGVAMATYVGQNFGARKFDRIRQGVRSISILSVAVAIVAGIVLWIFGKELVALFVNGEDSQKMIDYGFMYFQMNGPMYWVLSLLFVYRYTLQGLGDSKIPTFAGIMELIMRVVAAIVLGNLWGFLGLALSSPLAWIGSAVPLAITYHKRKYHLDELKRV
ncbi:MATE family efflux transporter [Aerococcaceae bacterium zg-ZJ1578]|uniref:MATE family efflux transporter n=1 Tax=Aerococcaceae TaxID=186827 RepID=UPI0013BB7623|nr:MULTISPECIES: MATE family efflux transporter [unclassified Facklamia]MBK0347951.1 MATE family efflux transporter [Aerococcaceae bacterium zg-1578]MBS4460950.1 MATE family efflux transporter [Aerococcaceae bacterium zg-B36]QQD66521.1 MATE family efflux transporter [Aerococcaceae bacterium zg-252]NEW64732.1 MATE family efflux transporter [Facklamia sp. 252]NEW68057.1 MATE family efflux transporter [Facklamia sp. 253]